MVRSLFVNASAGSGKTHRLIEQVRGHIENDAAFVVAATFTRAAAAEMEKRILERIEEGTQGADAKLRLIMRAGKARFSTIDALFHQFLSTEDCLPQVADDHERARITSVADARFFQDPLVLAEIENILIAARILRLPPESLIGALDRDGEALAAWHCPAEGLDRLKAEQARLAAAYGRLQERVRAAAEGTSGVLRIQVADALLEPIDGVDLGRALFRKTDLAEVRIAEAGRRTPAYALLRELYPPMRRLLAEHLVNTKRLRSAVLKRFGALRARVLAEEKERIGRLYFEDIPRALMDLDGPDSPDRPLLMARLYELGFHRTTHLLLDEFQDTSRIQFDLLRPLLEDILSGVGTNAEGARSLFLVGDWKQSIYQWRDAAPDHLKGCIAPFMRSGQIAVETLPHNYRSTPLLIGFFNHLTADLFADDRETHTQTPPDRRKDPCSGPSEVAVIPVACNAGDQPAYARLAELIRDKQDRCGCALGDMAVLCRTNAHMDRIAATLTQAGIPTSGLRGRELLSLGEGTALLLSLNAVFAGDDGCFTPRALSALGCSEALGAAVAALAGDAGRAPRPHRFAALAAALRGLRHHFPRVLIETLWDEAEQYFDRPDAADTAAFLRYLLAMSHLITVPEGEHADRVKLATIHSAKGLEFPHVFLFWKEGFDRTPGIPLPDDGCPIALSQDEIAFLATGPAAGAAAIAKATESMQEARQAETANLLYVAATRAVSSLTIILRAGKEGGLKGFSERIVRTAEQAIPGAERTDTGWRQDYGPEKPRQPDHEALSEPGLDRHPAPRTTGEEMDPTLHSAAVEAGIDRGLRIHGALARIAGDGGIVPGTLAGEELTAVERFLGDAGVREILFRPGAVLTEQHLSDTRSFGIVDRLIIAPDRITLIDFKTGRVGHLADKYRLQMIRYRTILQQLFRGRPVDCFLLFVDEPRRILEI